MLGLELNHVSKRGPRKPAGAMLTSKSGCAVLIVLAINDFKLPFGSLMTSFKMDDEIWWNLGSFDGATDTFVPDTNHFSTKISVICNVK